MRTHNGPDRLRNRASKPTTSEPQPFNERAHVLLSRKLDLSEQWLVQNGVCEARDADDYLTMLFIKVSGEFIEHATVFTENDGRVAGELFLSTLPGSKAGVGQDVRRCAIQLHWHPHYYFRNFYPLLQQTCLHLLQALPDVPAINANGVLMLAARTIPGIKADINRERRRRGATEDRSIVVASEARQSQEHLIRASSGLVYNSHFEL